jgi:hypothetical protein
MSRMTRRCVRLGRCQELSPWRTAGAYATGQRQPTGRSPVRSCAISRIAIANRRSGLRSHFVHCARRLGPLRHARSGIRAGMRRCAAQTARSRKTVAGVTVHRGFESLPLRRRRARCGSIPGTANRPRGRSGGEANDMTHLLLGRCLSSGHDRLGLVASAPASAGATVKPMAEPKGHAASSCATKAAEAVDVGAHVRVVQVVHGVAASEGLAPRVSDQVGGDEHGGHARAASARVDLNSYRPLRHSAGRAVVCNRS